MSDYPWWQLPQFQKFDAQLQAVSNIKQYGPQKFGPAPKKNLVQKYKTYGFIKTAKWLAYDFLSGITFGWIKSKPISAESPPSLQQTNKPTDNKTKKIINVEEPEEDNDVVTKGYLENGKFTGSFTTGDATTATVVKGLITDIS